MFDFVVMILLIVLPIVNCMSIACIKYQQNRSYLSCCYPYECYGETVCINTDNTI